MESQLGGLDDSEVGDSGDAGFSINLRAPGF